MVAAFRLPRGICFRLAYYERLALTVSRGSTSFSGSSISRNAPKRSYQIAARSSFASMARATPPTSCATASARSAAASKRSPPVLFFASHGYGKPPKPEHRHFITAQFLG